MTTRLQSEYDLKDATLHLPWVERYFDHLEITGTTTQNLDFTDLVPAGCCVVAPIVDILAAFTSGNGNTTNLALVLGDAVSANRFILTGNLFSLAAGTLTELGGAGAGLASSNGFFSATAQTLRIGLTATGGAPDLDDINAGAAIVRAYYSDRRRPSRSRNS